MPRIGAHMSIAGGIVHALERGEALGCETIQIFLRNNNRWEGKGICRAEMNTFKRVQRKCGITPVIGHTIYLVNLASPLDEYRSRSMKAIEDDLITCERLGIPYLILHAGSHLGSGEQEGIRRLVSGLNEIAGVTAKVQLLIETTSGAGSQIGHNFRQLEQIINRTHGKVGICLDTCHIFAAGYRINTESGFSNMVREIEKTIGYDAIKVIHVNDSKHECGSHIDRHEHIGRGYIGLKGFRLVLGFAPFRSLPFILETPKETDADGTDMDVVNIALLRGQSRKITHSQT